MEFTGSGLKVSAACPPQIPYIESHQIVSISRQCEFGKNVVGGINCQRSKIPCERRMWWLGPKDRKEKRPQNAFSRKTPPRIPRGWRWKHPAKNGNRRKGNAARARASGSSERVHISPPSRPATRPAPSLFQREKAGRSRKKNNAAAPALRQAASSGDSALFLSDQTPLTGPPNRTDRWNSEPQPSISATIARSSTSSLLVTAILDFANSSISKPVSTS